MTDIEKTKEFLARQNYMVLAVVCEDGTPWATPVKIQDRGEKSFEWDSRTDTVHSQAIAHNSAVAITLFEKLDDSQFGFYAKGTARVVEDKGNGLARYRVDISQSWVNDETFVKREVEITGN